MSQSKSISAKSTCLSSLFIIALWALISYQIDTYALPSPLAVWRHICSELSANLFVHLFVSFYRIAAGIFLSLITAIPLGMAVGRSRRVERVISPLIYILYPIPKIVFLPIFMVLFGIGDLSKILMISIIVFFQVLVVTRDAAKGICPQIIDSITSLGAGKIDIYQHVVVPACLPKILTSLRISFGTSMTVLFLTETYATTYGIGYYMMDAMTRFNYPDVFLGVIAMSCMGFTFFFVLERLERKYCSWKKH